jgi:DNA sulfur modification protein DndD
MRINRIILENYGLFLGRNEIDLIPRSEGHNERPIILIGGMNGSGKTTLLDAVRLALYGKSSVGDRVSEKRYQEHLRGLVHRSGTSLVQFEYARVGVEFDFVSRGNKETYYIQRCWSLRNGNGVEESLQIYKRDSTSRDGDYNTWPTIPGLEPEHWQAFVNDVVPERLSQLFFFDGEKIKRIAEDITGDIAIAESIRSLLGLDTVKRLKADLGILATREVKQYLASDEKAALNLILEEIEAIQTALECIEHDRAEVETATRSVEGEIKRLERQLQEQGGAFMGDRIKKKTRQAVLEAEIQLFHRKIRQECEGLFPLALCPGVASALEKQIEGETESRRKALAKREIALFEEQLIRKLHKVSSFPNEASRLEVIQIVRETVEAQSLDQNRETGVDGLIGLSELDARRVQSWLYEAKQSSALAMRKLCNDLEAHERETQKIRRQLDRAPDQISLAPEFNDLSAQNQLLGQKLVSLKELDEKTAKLKNDLAAKERERDRLLERGRQNAEVQDRLTLVENVQNALEEYLVRLTGMKVETLCGTVTECFNRLTRKGDLLFDISIDPQSFEVRLHDKVGRIIPREELSAGEKQILAISILWGLAKTAGRPLPVIIDTPLGRLDSDHRMNLVQNYFPYAGHQVILLSTDTEVDKRLFLDLQPFISHSYHLVYDKDERRTYPRKEYFWTE